MILDNHFSIPSHGLAIACLAFLAATDLSVACAALARPQRSTGSAVVSQSQKATDPARSAEAPWLDGFNGTTLDGE